jgi:2-oxoglutarate ferredoxin oxidoreductase subunit delta
MRQVSGKEVRPLMARVEIDRDRCKGCGLCTISCPKELLHIGEEMNQYGYFCARWDNDGECTGCAICGEICPDVAIRVWRERGRSKP